MGDAPGRARRPWCQRERSTARGRTGAILHAHAGDARPARRRSSARRGRRVLRDLAPAFVRAMPADGSRLGRSASRAGRVVPVLPGVVGGVLGARSSVASGCHRRVWLVASVAAHGVAPTEPPSAASLLLGWTFPPLPTLGILVDDRLVDLGRPPGRCGPPREPGPDGAGPSRSCSGCSRSRFAVASGIERYDTSLFSVHMVQHVLLMLVAAPLIALVGADHAGPAAVLARDAKALDPARSSTRGSSASSPTPSSPGSCSRR